MKWFVLYVAILTVTVACYVACNDSLYKKGSNSNKKSIDVFLEDRMVLRIEVDSLQYLGDPIIKVYCPLPIKTKKDRCPNGIDGDPGPAGIEKK